MMVNVKPKHVGETK